MSRRDDKRRAALRAAALDLGRPTGVRLARGDFRRDTIADPDSGAPRRAWRSRDLLDTLARNGTITKGMRRAGRRFQATFHAAQVGGVKAGPLVFLPGAPGPSRAPSAEAESAREALADLAAQLGGRGSAAFCCLWYVLGGGHTIEAWAQRMGWNGRALDRGAARGILIAALDQLDRSGWARPGRD